MFDKAAKKVKSTYGKTEDNYFTIISVTPKILKQIEIQIIPNQVTRA